MTRRRKIAGLTALGLGAVFVLAACGPTPTPAPPTVSCNGGPTHTAAIESCHQQINPYSIDGNLQQQAQASINRYAGSACPPAGGLQHQLGPSAQAENLYCKNYGTGACPSPQQFANDAVNAWLASPGHQANITNFAWGYLGAGYTCTAGHAFGGVQFHH
jgi:hypothetical protein